MYDFFNEYFRIVKDTEPPIIFHRWVALSCIGAILSRNYHFQLGHFPIYPNMYTMLVGVSGTRKSTAIKIGKAAIVQAGYTHVAASATSKEQFLIDLASDHINGTDILEQNLWGNNDKITDCFIVADEFNNFFGNNILSFISLLGELWDFTESIPYKNRVKNSKSVEIPNPTINILGGNTPTGIATVFPPESLGQGFFTRLIFIYSEPSSRRITIPPKPDVSLIATQLRAIANTVSGIAETSPGAEKLLDKIYKSNLRIDDIRFDQYSTRRLTHLIKLCLIVSASRYSNKIIEQDVVFANTILTHAEHFMPKALGEFGKAKHSDVSHKVVQMIENHPGIATMKEIWKHVQQDLETVHQLSDILKNLQLADKIQMVESGFLPKKKLIEQTKTDVLDFSLLTDEEKGMAK